MFYVPMAGLRAGGGGGSGSGNGGGNCTNVHQAEVIIRHTGVPLHTLTGVGVGVPQCTAICPAPLPASGGETPTIILQRKVQSIRSKVTKARIRLVRKSILRYASRFYAMLRTAFRPGG